MMLNPGQFNLISFDLISNIQAREIEIWINSINSQLHPSRCRSVIPAH